MGDVYRADDLTLGQPVALKFLPEKLADDRDRLERFYNEVRIARQITHPSVCRVHDVSEVDGQPFLSMEFVDGENLASLLRRIGRLPADKALEIARQICAGLAAAHDGGVLHRDLKPDNVMVDGKGRARITDFGLAGLAEFITGDEVRSGTPAYMSPEQLLGREVTFRSDLYALGLVLYELLTGRRAFDARQYADLVRQHTEEQPTPPSELVPGLDPAIESVVLRCLDKDPARRPASALWISAALPGGDPLAQALAAGETPSPEMVAAAGADGRLPARQAVAATLLALAGLLGTVALTSASRLQAYQPLSKSPAALEDRARETLAALAGTAEPADSAFGLGVDADLVIGITAKSRDLDRWTKLGRGQPPAILFWYRQGPLPLAPRNARAQIRWDDPPATMSHMAGVVLDARGRLVEMYAVPPEKEAGGEAGGAVDWTPLLRAAGFDAAALEPTTPQWSPAFYVDTRAAWTGRFPDAPEVPIRLEAGSYRGRPVYLRTVGEWTRAERMVPGADPAALRTANAIMATVFVLIMVVGGLMARRNLARNRGDRRGARHLAGAAFALSMSSWLLGGHHVVDFARQLGMLGRALGLALLFAASIWMLYIAVEPYVRRAWPHALIAWSRLLAGGISDPLVCRHVLHGAMAGTAFAFLISAVDVIPAWLGQPPPSPSWYHLDILLGPRHALALVATQMIDTLSIGTGMFMLLVILRALLRSEKVAAAVIATTLGLVVGLQSELGVVPGVLLATTLWTIPVWVMLRWGLVALLSCVFFLAFPLNFPLQLEFGGWVGPGMVAALAPAVAIVLHAFRSVRGREPLFGSLLAD
jgi:serine/threonine-protein kinase